MNVPAVNGKVDAKGWRIDSLLLGIGGHGGDVVWNVGEGHAFDTLRDVLLVSGVSGDGAARGGYGGLVRYRSSTVINAASMPRATALLAISSGGGNVEASFVNGGSASPVRLYLDNVFSPPSGGASGPIVAHANAGRAGENGQAGGKLQVAYGRGGSVVDTAVHPNGRCGRGGGLADPEGLDRIVDPDNLIAPLAIGAGGDGAQPGPGGTLDYDWIRFRAPGRSGAGNPPGRNGADGRVQLDIAGGGKHPADGSIVGANSEVRGVKVVDVVPEPSGCSTAPFVLAPLTEIDLYTTTWPDGRQESRRLEVTTTLGAAEPGTNLAPVTRRSLDSSTSVIGSTTTIAAELTCLDTTHARERITRTTCGPGGCNTTTSERDTGCPAVNIYTGL